jgi:hypothetical protein
MMLNEYLFVIIPDDVSHYPHKMTCCRSINVVEVVDVFLSCCYYYYSGDE